MSAALVALSVLLGAAPPEERVRVEGRQLVKEQHLFAAVGPTWFARGDYYDAPGGVLSAAFYPSEGGGVEVKAGYFASGLSAAAREVFAETGLVPDAHRPVGLALAGWRQSLGYGKVLVGDSRAGLLHFDVQGAVHAGLVFTDRALSPALMLSPGLLVRAGERFFVQAEVGLVGAWEQREAGFLAVGVLPLVSLGVRL